jgi:hypothetical protein
MTIISESATHKVEIGGVLITTPKKIINLADFGELLPDAVIVELEDFKTNLAEVAGKRQAAARVLLRISSGVKIDAYSDKITTLLTQLVTHTTLTTEQATAILDDLRS